MNSICPLCNSNKYKIIGTPITNSISKNFIIRNYSVVQCNECQLYYIIPPISFTSKQWSELYNSEYFSQQSNWLIKKRRIELNQRFDKALSFLKATDNISLLDIGTGEGKTLIEGSKRNWNVTGIDIVDNRIDEAKREKIKFIKGNFLDLNLPENHFDFIYIDSVLEHVINPKEYLVKINRILKKGGIAYIGVPNEDSLFNDIKKIAYRLTGKKNLSAKIKPFDSPYHVIGFNKNSLNKIFNDTEFEILYIRNFGRNFDFLSHKPDQRGFWIGLFFLLPVEFIGRLTSRDVYLEAYIEKK
jgi:ubiquinone/menaquinone biosynthesis C-methylase UbiE